MRTRLAARLAVTLGIVALAILVSVSAANAPTSGAAVSRSGPPPAAVPSPVSMPTSAQVPGIIAASSGGAAAIERLGPRLTEVAASHGWSAEQLTETLISDPTLHIDATDRLFYVEPAVDAADLQGAGIGSAELPQAAAPFPLSETFALHGLPGAKLTILLDFGPRTMSGNAWTIEGRDGSDIVCPVWSLDSDPAFSNTEMTAIQEIWQRVAEDYAPFNVDVTTEFTGEAAITRSSSADQAYGTRVLVSPISSYFGAYGGIAYIGMFDDVGDYYKPALVFPEMLGNNSKAIAEAASHECGHNLNLLHDGVPGDEYYEGSGSGETGWAPIMGAGYYRDLTQWSRGEYPAASNKVQDDLAILGGYLAYRPDDAGGSLPSAAVLAASSTLSTAGLITSSSDVDVYRFAAGAGPATIDITPAAVGPNLDVAAEIRDSSGNLIASSNPAAQVAAHLATTLQSGTYYLFVRGTGKGSPLDVGGYSSYASIGQYTVGGTVSAGAPPPVTTAAPQPSNGFSSWVSSDVTVTLSATSTVGGIAWTRYRTNGGAEQTYTGSPFTVSQEGTTTLTYQSQDNGDQLEVTNTATIRIDRTPPVTDAAALQSAYGAGSGASISLAASDDKSGVMSTAWRIGPSGVFTSGTTIPVPADEGSYQLQYYSVDRVGNVEPIREAAFEVTGDHIAPRTSSNAKLTYISSARISLTATDTGLGVETTKWLLDGIAGSGPTVETDVYGSHKLTFWSEDLAGNSEVPTVWTFFVRDGTAPVVTSKAVPAYTDSARIRFTAADEASGSGVGSVSYRLDGSATRTVSGSVADLQSTQLGAHTVLYWAVDKAGNSSALKALAFRIVGPTRISIGRPPAPAAVGRTVTLAARIDTSTAIAPVLGAPFLLQVYSGGAWSRAVPLPARATATGTLSFVFTPYKSAVYRVVTAPGTALRYGASSSLVIGVRAKVTAPSKPSRPQSPRAGRRFTLTGNVTPARIRSARVVWYRVSGTKLTRYSSRTVKLTSAGKWTVRRSLPRGTWAVRVVYTDSLKIVTAGSYRRFRVR